MYCITICITMTHSHYLICMVELCRRLDQSTAHVKTIWVKSDLEDEHAIRRSVSFFLDVFKSRLTLDAD